MVEKQLPTEENHLSTIIDGHANLVNGQSKKKTVIFFNNINTLFPRRMNESEVIEEVQKAKQNK